MTFVFEISNYDAPGLEMEMVELLRQRFETHSRRTLPGMWKLRDRLHTYAARGPGREKRRRLYHIYGVWLIALGLFALIPGLMNPVTPALVGAGLFAIFGGILEFLLVRKGNPTVPIPAQCRREAQEQSERLRAVDWSAVTVQVRFGDDGMTISTDNPGENPTDHSDDNSMDNPDDNPTDHSDDNPMDNPDENPVHVARDEISNIFETEHLYLVLYGDNNAVFLQKKDIVSGNPDAFLPDIRIPSP